jgi:hypothetical protein
MPTLIHATDWTHAGTIAAVGAGQILYDNWTDVHGNTFSTSGSSPNSVLTSVNVAFNIYQLQRPSSDTTGIPDTQVVVTFTAITATTQEVLLMFRIQSNQSGYSFVIYAQNNGTINVDARLIAPGGSNTTIATGVWSGSMTSGHVFVITGAISGAVLSINIHDSTAGADVTNSTWSSSTMNSVGGQGTNTVTVTDATVSASGIAGIGVAQNLPNVTNIALYNNSTVLTDLGLIASGWTGTTYQFSHTFLGGVGPFTEKLYGNTTANVQAILGNLIATNPTWPYTITPGNHNIKYYNVATTDSSPLTITSNEIGAAALAPVNLLFVADSLIAYTPGLAPGNNQNGGTYTVADMVKGIAWGDAEFASGIPGLLRMIGPRSMGVTNQAHAGATTTKWLKADPLSTGYYAAAVTAANAAGSTHLIFCLGGNDAAAGASAATFQANASSIITNLLGDVPTLLGAMLVETPYYANTNQGTAGPINALLDTYRPTLDSLANGSTIKRGPKGVYQFFANIPTAPGTSGAPFFSDGHFTEIGAIPFAEMISGAFAVQFFGAGGGGGAGGGSGGRNVIDVGGGIFLG